MKERPDGTALSYLLTEPVDGPYWKGWVESAGAATIKEAVERLSRDEERGVLRPDLAARLAGLRGAQEAAKRGKSPEALPKEGRGDR